MGSREFLLPVSFDGTKITMHRLTLLLSKLKTDLGTKEPTEGNIKAALVKSYGHGKTNSDFDWKDLPSKIKEKLEAERGPMAGTPVPIATDLDERVRMLLGEPTPEPTEEPAPAPREEPAELDEAEDEAEEDEGGFNFPEVIREDIGAPPLYSSDVIKKMEEIKELQEKIKTYIPVYTVLKDLDALTYSVGGVLSLYEKYDEEYKKLKKEAAYSSTVTVQDFIALKGKYEKLLAGAKELALHIPRAFENCADHVFNDFSMRALTHMEKIIQKVGEAPEGTFDAQIVEMRKILENRGFAPTTTVRGHSDLEILVAQWNSAKEFLNMLKRNLFSVTDDLSIDPLIIEMGQLESESPALVPIARNYLNIWFETSGFTYRLEEDKSIAAQLKEFKKDKEDELGWDQKAAQGREWWSTVYQTIDATGFSNTEIISFNKLRTLNYFEAIAFYNAYNTMREYGVDTDKSRRLLVVTMVKLDSIESSPLKQSYLNNAVAHLAKVCAYNPSLFTYSLEFYAERIPNPDQTVTLNFDGLGVITARWMRIFENASYIPLMAGAVYTRQDFVGDYIYEDPYIRYFATAPPGFAQGVRDRNEAIRLRLPPGPFAPINVNQYTVTVNPGSIGGGAAGGLTQQATVNPASMGFNYPESEAPEHYAKGKRALFPQHVPLSIAEEFPGSVLGALKEPALSRALEGTLLIPEEPGYAWTPMRDIFGGGAGVGQKSQDTFVASFAYLSDTGIFGGTGSQRTLYNQDQQLFVLGMRGLPIGSLNVHESAVGYEKVKVTSSSLNEEQSTLLASAATEWLKTQEEIDPSTGEPRIDPKTGKPKKVDLSRMPYFVLMDRRRTRTAAGAEEEDATTMMRAFYVVQEPGGKPPTLYELHYHASSDIGRYNFLAARWIQDFEKWGITAGFTGVGPGVTEKFPGAGFDTSNITVTDSEKKKLKEQAVADYQATELYSNQKASYEAQGGDASSLDLEDVDVAALEKRTEEMDEKVADGQPLTTEEQQEYKKNLVLLGMKEGTDNYWDVNQKEMTQAYLEEKKKKAANYTSFSAVLALDLPKEWVTGTMVSQVPGWYGQPVYQQILGGGAKNWISGGDSGKEVDTMVLVGSYSEGVEGQRTEGYRITRVSGKYRRIKEKEITTDGEKKMQRTGWELQFDGGVGKAIDGRNIYLAGGAYHYEGVDSRLGISGGYADAQAIYSNAMMEGLEGAEKLQEEFERLKHIYINMYGGIKGNGWMLGTLDHFVIEMAGKQPNEYYWDLLGVLKLFKEYGVRIEAERFPAFMRVLNTPGLLDEIMIRGPSGEGAPEQVNKIIDELTKEAKTIFEDYYLGLRLSENFSVELYVIGEEEKQEFLLGDPKERTSYVALNALYTFGKGSVFDRAGFLNLYVQIPVGMSVLSSEAQKLGVAGAGFGIDVSEDSDYLKRVAFYFSELITQKRTFNETGKASSEYDRVGRSITFSAVLFSNIDSILEAYKPLKEYNEWLIRVVAISENILAVDTELSELKSESDGYEVAKAKLEAKKKALSEELRTATDPSKTPRRLLPLVARLSNVDEETVAKCRQILGSVEAEIKKLDDRTMREVYFHIRPIWEKKDEYEFAGGTTELLFHLVKEGTFYVLVNWEKDRGKRVVFSSTENPEQAELTAYAGASLKVATVKPPLLPQGAIRVDLVGGVGLTEPGIKGAAGISYTVPVGGKDLTFTLMGHGATGGAVDNFRQPGQLDQPLGTYPGSSAYANISYYGAGFLITWGQAGLSDIGSFSTPYIPKYTTEERY